MRCFIFECFTRINQYLPVQKNGKLTEQSPNDDSLRGKETWAEHNRFVNSARKDIWPLSIDSISDFITSSHLTSSYWSILCNPVQFITILDLAQWITDERSIPEPTIPMVLNVYSITFDNKVSISVKCLFNICFFIRWEWNRRKFKYEILQWLVPIQK